MNKKKLILIAGAIALCVTTSFVTVMIYKITDKDKFNSETVANPPAKFASMTGTEIGQTDFTTAAERTVHSVVHVKTMYKIRNQYQGFSDPFFEHFFGVPRRQQREMPEQESSAAGSGVIISADGYIVTNNHVVENAFEIEVTLNDKRTFTAKVIGTDPSTDIALLKIDADGLAPITFGNSDNLKVGQWVLAVGNPFNLTSTVTAGIVSAKARSINILSVDMKIESFIQTDAAINPGNSGGALVNTAGELVGINTAIASQTGSYAGYAFAVPTTIVSKVVTDLKEYGVVQRAVLGSQITDIDDKLAKEKDLKTLNGAYVAGFTQNSAAKDAGLKEGDVITAIDEVAVKSVAELQEQISRYRPGDNIKLTVLRKDKEQIFTIKLKNMSGNTGIVKNADLSVLGAEFQQVTPQLKRRFNLEDGMLTSKVTRNGAFAKAGIEAGFIVLKINRQTIRSQEDIANIYNSAINSSEEDDKVLLVSGIYQNGKVMHYIVNLK
ncbi:MAG: Do family serine endopeptidase [Prevotellaceae bacterium]|jgi:Do/DeqQ family serine protease|nr:Do family serine endopeptidase [Prevotellaceae bacterium]